MYSYDLDTLKTAVIDEIATWTTKWGGVYPSRPNNITSDAQIKNFIVVSVNDNVVDCGVYAVTYIYITLYAKDIKTDNATVVNSKLLSTMYNVVAENMPTQLGRLLFSATPTIGADRADDFGYHIKQLKFQTIIKQN